MENPIEPQLIELLVSDKKLIDALISERNDPERVFWNAKLLSEMAGATKKEVETIEKLIERARKNVTPRGNHV